MDLVRILGVIIAAFGVLHTIAAHYDWINCLNDKLLRLNQSLSRGIASAKTSLRNATANLVEKRKGIVGFITKLLSIIVGVVYLLLALGTMIWWASPVKSVLGQSDWAETYAMVLIFGPGFLAVSYGFGSLCRLSEQAAEALSLVIAIGLLVIVQILLILTKIPISAIAGYRRGPVQAVSAMLTLLGLAIAIL
ncbi:hypothetical protein [Roseospirillum parvum]|uniref:hypothetical protein n=1 Tax=Roseospirillum parvum TaxID=83401 RepID=UPI001160D17B|nr:hypothetical protein [Roseospirillum parvum]